MKSIPLMKTYKKFGFLFDDYTIRLKKHFFILIHETFNEFPDNTTVQGNVLVNGCPVGPFMYRLSGFVHQEDLFFGSLTVREHLTCMAHLKLDRRVKRKFIQKIINEILDEVGLQNSADTRIGEEGEGMI
jgi:hypothetical protein